MIHGFEKKGASVVIVDDDPVELALFHALFHGGPYRTFFFKSGRAALGALDRVQPDLIVLDVRMPGMDGFEVCRRIRENDRLRQVPVMFVSVLPDRENRLRAFASGAVDYLMKPVRREVLTARIQVHLALAARQCSQGKNDIKRK